MGGRVNSMLWVLEEEEEKGGIWEKRRFSLAPHCEKKKKKLLMVLLHDWAFVTAIVLPDTSARGQQAPRQLVSNQSLSTSS